LGIAGENVAAGFSLRQQRLKTCATIIDSDGRNPGGHKQLR
jgi:hypothetical protein